HRQVGKMAATIKKNLPFLKEQFSAAFSNSSVVVKCVGILVFLSYFLTFSETALSILTVIPGNVIPPNFWIWTYFTHSFIETHIWIVIIDVVVIVLYGKLLEPLWGALQMLVFFLVVNFGVGVITSFVYLCIYVISRNDAYLFKVHIHGLAGYIAGFSVAVKQVMPDHVVVDSPFGKLGNRHIPILMLMITIFVRILGGLDGPFPIMFGSGILVSWIYLRFYQKHSNGNRGDMAESFSFASFFPDVIQPFIAVICNTIFSALVKIKVCKKPQRRYDVSSPSTITISLPGTDPLDAERRRKLALTALNERLSKTDSSQQSWPSLEDGAESPSPTKDTSGPLLTSVKVDTKEPQVHTPSEEKALKEPKETMKDAEKPVS
ncbi:unnamed protein product, partial [Owenia fusiformis]